MKIIDKHFDVPVTMQGDRSSISGLETIAFFKDFQSAMKGGALMQRAEEGGTEFVGDRFIRLSGQTETLPADLYNQLSTLDPTWRPYILDFTRTIAMREKVYQPIYETMESPDFDETMKIVDFTGFSSFAYTKWIDGAAVLMNTFRGGSSDSVTLQIHAGGYVRTLRDRLFNKRWRQEKVARAQAEGYNDFLNHLYLGPILKASYSGKTVDVSDVDAAQATTWWAKNWSIMKLAKDAYYTAKDPLEQPFDVPVLFMNKATYMTAFSDTLDEISFADGKRYTSMRGWWNGIVVYDGATVDFDGQPVTYPKPADGVVYMISPKKGFKELVKQPLTMVTSPGDANHLSEQTQVWWDCRGIICAANDYGVKMTLVMASDTTNGIAD